MNTPTWRDDEDRADDLQEQVRRLKQIVQEQHEAIQTLAQWAMYGVDDDTDRALDYVP